MGLYNEIHERNYYDEFNEAQGELENLHIVLKKSGINIKKLETLTGDSNSKIAKLREEKKNLGKEIFMNEYMLSQWEVLGFELIQAQILPQELCEKILNTIEHVKAKKQTRQAYKERIKK